MIFRNLFLRPFSLLSLPITVLSLLLLSGEFSGKRVSAQPIVPANDGTGTIVAPDGNTFNIQGGQLSADQANLFHSFQQFGLNPDQIANFLSQPNIRNILGRVVGGDPSIIQGLIRVSGGNTNLYLMNPSGIIFGPTARLDVPANFAATTATSIQFDREFFNAIGSNNYSALTGNPNAYVFSSQTGDIVNAGELKLEPGKVLTLIANTVTNTGEISSEGGQVILASMPEPGVVRLSQPGQVLSVEYEVGDSASVPTDEPISVADLSEILNQTQDYDLGFTLTADGSVQLSVSPIKVAPNPGTTIASGTIDVSGETGGQVDILGETVAVIDAEIDASGTNLGGVIHIGGELQGKGTTPTAQRTVVDANSILKVDAVDQGNGGEAIVWADGRTDFAGTISAKGGANGGDGGFVEVSGKDSLSFTGTVDTSAENGATGTLLLDPTDILIVDGDNVSGDSELSSLSGIVASDYVPLTGEPFTISEVIVENLLLSSNVSLAATNNITIADLTDNTLGNFSSSIGNLTLTADADNSGAGSVTMNSGDTIAIGGNINLSGASLTLGALNTRGTVTLQAAQNITVGGIGAGFITMTSTSGSIDFGGIDTDGGGVTVQAAQNIIAGGINTQSETSNGGNLQFTSTKGNIVLTDEIRTSSFASSGRAGNITFSSGGTIDASDEGIFTLRSDTGGLDELGESYTLEALSDSGFGGNVSLTAVGDITLGLVDTHGSLGGGNIFMESTGGSVNAIVSGLPITIGSTLNTGILNSSSTQGAGGAVTLQAANNVTVGAILSGSASGNGGNVSLTSTNGSVTAISTATLISIGGAPQTRSAGGIVTGTIGSGQGGTITISAPGDIRTGWLLTGSPGGTVVSDLPSLPSSVSGGGNVTLTSTSGSIDTTVNLTNLTVLNSSLLVDLGLTPDQAFLVTQTGLELGMITASQNGSGGAIALNAAGDIRTGAIDGGSITMTSTSGAIDTRGGSLSTSSSSGNKGNIVLNAAGNIQTGGISTASSTSSSGTISSVNAGSVEITSRSGSIDTTATTTSSSGFVSGGINSSSNSGTGGAVTLEAAQNITVGTIAGGAITMTSASGSIDTKSSPGFSMSGDEITLQADQNITTGEIETGSSTANGGNLQITTTKGNIVLAGDIDTGSNAPSGRGGDITLSSGSTIDASEEERVDDLDDYADSYTLDTSSSDGFGGNVSLTAVGDIALGLVETSGFLGGGNISMTSTRGNVNAITSDLPVTAGDSSGTLNTGILNSSSSEGNGGTVTLEAQGNVTVGSILSGSANGNGGNVTLTSTNGSVSAISTGTLTSSSGVSETLSVGGIITGTTGSGQGGTITINAPSDIRTGWLLTGSPGGTVVSSSPSLSSSISGGGNVKLTSNNGSIDTTINVTNLDAGLLVDLGLTPAQAALASQAGVELGMIITGSQNGNAGTVDLTAAGDIRTGAIVSGSLNGTGGAVTLNSSGGSIDTSNDALFTGLTREAWLEAASAAGLASTDTIDFAQDLGFGSGTYTVDQLATILDGFSFRPGIITGSDGGTGADVTLTAAGNITTSNIITSSISGNSGKIEIRSSGGKIDGQEGVLLSGISADLLQSLGVDSDLSTVLGYLARPDVAFGGYITLSLTGNGGDITLNAAGDVLTNYLATSSFSGRPGNINILSGGNVRVGRVLSNLANGILPPEFSSLNDDRTDQLAELLSRGVLNSSGATAGGSITVDAATSITTGAVNSSSTQGSGGSVLLDPSGDIEVYSINSQGGTQLGSSSAESSVIGGDVTIVTDRYFRALGSFIDQNGITASISTAAPGTGGAITINHGGNGTKPFTIGVPLSAGDVNGNGSLGALTTGEYTIFPYNIDPTLAAALANGNEFRIAPEAGYDFTERFGPIGVISVDRPVCQDNDCTPPPPTCQEQGTCPEVDTGESSNRILSIDEARDILALVEQRTGVKPALIYISFESPDFQLLQSDQQFTQNESRNSQEFEDYLNVPDRIQGPGFTVEPSDRDVLRLMVVTSSEDPFLISVPGATRDRVLTLGGQLYQSILEQATEGVYLRASQQLYNQLVAPIRQTLEEREVDNLVFIMDTSLRLLPIAALHDGQQYLIENYSVGLMPSINLTDTRFVDIKEVGLLAMGADTFSDEAALPSVPTELSIISELWGSSDPFLNDRFTLDNLRSSRQNQRYGILHLATHGDFKPGAAAESYIRFGDRRVTLDQLRSLRLYDPTVELMVLSACRTAVGNVEAELGFAGLAHQAGVKTVLGSLWYVGDQATLGLMTSFYSNLRNAPIKAEALRQAQLAMLRGEVTFEDGAINLLGKQFPLRPETAQTLSGTSVNLKHPYAWSAFTMVGSPW